jgi:hypothetical protein
MPDTVVAEVIVVFGNRRSEELLISLEHMSAAPGVAPSPIAVSATPTRTIYTHLRPTVIPPICSWLVPRTPH